MSQNEASSKTRKPTIHHSMGTNSYNNANFEECVRFLFKNAETALDSIHKFTESFNYAIEKDIPKTIRIFSRTTSN